MSRRRKQTSVFQAHLPFKSAIPARRSAVSFALERRMFVSFGVVLLAFAVFYSYFVMLSVSHVVVREEILHETELLADEVAHLERQYLADSAQLTEARALAHGFTRTQKHTFIERGSFSLSNTPR